MHQIPSTQMNSHLQFPEHEHLNCPRCDSDNTKFCYYNNYNLSQPRHYCKNCRRYWTKGGTLRKIPIGGGTRKTTKRSSTSNKRHADSSTTPPLPVQLKPDSSPVFDFNNDNNQSKLSFNSLLRSNYQSFLTPNLMDGLDKTAGTDVFQVNYLGTTTTTTTNNNNNESGESSGCDLSIFTSGSSFP